MSPHMNSRAIHQSGIKHLDCPGKLKHLKLHGKMLLADHSRAIVGSINLTPGSFDSRRELAIEVRDPHVIERLEKVVRRDWENSRRIDLSDAGLMAELQDTDANVAEDLALNPTDK